MMGQAWGKVFIEPIIDGSCVIALFVIERPEATSHIFTVESAFGQQESRLTTSELPRPRTQIKSDYVDP